MTQRAVRRETTSLDPMFYIPEGVDELFYEETNDGFDVVNEGEPVQEFSEVFDESFVELESDYDFAEGDVDYAETPETPQVIGVVPPQVIRMTATGAEVVDIILDVEDIIGATKYEFRVTKI